LIFVNSWVRHTNKDVGVFGKGSIQQGYYRSRKKKRVLSMAIVCNNSLCQFERKLGWLTLIVLTLPIVDLCMNHPPGTGNQP
jgi:hypothetical protein